MTNMTKPTLGVAVVGTGFGEKIHIPGFQEHPRTEVVAVYNPSLEKAQQVAKYYEIPHACASLAEIVALPDVDAVSISTPPFLHYEMAKEVLQARKHLLLEKPMTMDATQVRELYQLANQKGVSAIADFEFRFVPSWQRFAELLQEGFVGKPRLIKIDWLVASRANPERGWNWYAQKDKGGGALGAIGSHAFDYIHWLFGEVKQMTAMLSVAIPQRPDPQENGKLKPVDADDTDLILLELIDGTPCQVSLSSVTYAGRGHWLEVYGDQGTLVLGSSNLKDYVHGFELYAATAGKDLEQVEIPPRLVFPKVYPDGRLAPFIRIVNHWLDCIDAGQTVAPSLKEGVYSQLLMDLTHQASASRTWLDVPALESYIS
jgi:predicted dehydrogenase